MLECHGLDNMCIEWICLYSLNQTTIPKRSQTAKSWKNYNQKNTISEYLLSNEHNFK